MSPAAPALGLAVVATAAAGLAPSPVQAQAVRGAYVYTLSSFTGPIPYSHSRLTVDRERNEVYVLYQNAVTVFNDSGMEVYHFGDDLSLGHVVDLAIDENGDILLLAYRESDPRIIRCDYRGRPQSEVGLQGLPAALAGFQPNRMVLRRGQLALASTMGLVIVTADTGGRVHRTYDLASLFEIDQKDRGAAELGGFSVDGEGNLLMTIPVLFRAFVLSPDGKVDWFGRPGGAPGRFNIAGGIASDSRGNLLIVDKLKGSVMVFTHKFVFLTQFATRGYRASQLIFPGDLAIDARDRVYVTQAGRRGVSVFQLTYP